MSWRRNRSWVRSMLAIACDRAPDNPTRERAEAMTLGAAVASTGESPAVLSQRGTAADGATSERLLMSPPVATNASSVKANDAGGISFGAPMPLTDPSGAMLIRNGQASVEVKRMDDAVA